jgi:hypothetical protein
MTWPASANSAPRSDRAVEVDVVPVGRAVGILLGRQREFAERAGTDPAGD